MRDNMSNRVAAIAAVGLLLASAVSTKETPDFTQPPIANLSNYQNGSLFDQWRPKAHFIHPSNQLGDPTAFWADPDDGGKFHFTALYSYIRGSGNASLGTSSFSGATTCDLLHYEDLSGWENPVQMGPGNAVDPVADFDGGVVAKGYKGLPTLIWTAVKGLPISWTIPYNDGYESQALAYSEDKGKSWIKLDGGANVPVIPLPPYTGNVVTGFRDPWMFQNAQFDKLLNNDTDSSELSHYISMSSGLHSSGPRIWLYRQSNESSNFTQWDFLGPLLQSEINTTFVEPGSGFAGTDYSDGNNYETSQVTSLGYHGDTGLEGTGMGFVSFGAESNKTMMLYRLGHWVRTDLSDIQPSNSTASNNRTTVTAAYGVEMNTTMEGVLDWGLSYACTGTRDVVKNRRISLCWIKEAFADQDSAKYTTEYISSLTLPRELYVKRLNNVVDNPSLTRQRGSWSILTNSSSLDSTIAANETYTSPVAGRLSITMLGIRPACELEAYRSQAEKSYCSGKSVTLSAASLDGNSSSSQTEVRRGVRSGTETALVDEAFVPLAESPCTRHYELETTMTFSNSSLRNDTAGDFAAGISILRSNSSSENRSMEDISIVYRPANESVIVQRRTALGGESVLQTPEIGKLRLWETIAGDDGSAQVQNLTMRVFVDGSALEVYINDVFALTTRAYYWYTDSNTVGYVYQRPANATQVDDEASSVTFSNTSWWQGLVNAYPNRPTDKNQLIKQAVGYAEPDPNPNAAGVVYNGTGPAPPFPVLP